MGAPESPLDDPPLLLALVPLLPVAPLLLLAVPLLLALLPPLLALPLLLALVPGDDSSEPHATTWARTTRRPAGSV